MVNRRSITKTKETIMGRLLPIPRPSRGFAGHSNPPPPPPHVKMALDAMRDAMKPMLKNRTYTIEELLNIEENKLTNQNE